MALHPVKLAIAGDLMLGRQVNDSLGKGDYARPWGDLLPTLRTADLFLVNLECALTTRRERWTDGGYKPFYFRADPAVVATLKHGRVDFVSLANNHIGDFGAEGLRDTVAVLDREGIAHAGAGIDHWSACEPALLAAHGTRLAVVAFADYPSEWSATVATPGINYAPVTLAPEHFNAVRVALAMARERADIVLFSIHWGPNMRARPTPEFREFAHAVIDAGADVFWGHSAHVVQGVEVWHDHPILYDTGDLVDDYTVDPHLRNDLSALFVVDIEPPRVQSVRLTPVSIADLQVRVAHGRDRDWFVERFARHCAELGSNVTTALDEVHVVIPSGEETHDSAMAG